MTNCSDLADFGQLWPDLWPSEIVGMAMTIVAIPDISSMVLSLCATGN